MSNPPPDPGHPQGWQQPGDRPRSQSQWGEPQPQGQWGQPQPQGQWGQQPAMPYAPAGAPANPYDSESTPILVTGILSLVLCGLIGIYAWIKGNDLQRRANASGWPEPSTAKVGRILGIIGSIIGILQIGFAVLWLLLVFGAIGAGVTTG